MSHETPYSAKFISDGLSSEQAKKRYHDRRQTCLNSLSKPLIIFGTQADPGHHVSWWMSSPSIIQDPFMLFYTGINQHQCILILDPHHANPVRLFAPLFDANRRHWDGDYLAVDDPSDPQRIQTITGIQDVYDINECLDTIQSDYANSEIGSAWYPVKSGPQTDAFQWIRKIKRSCPKIKITNLQSSLFDQRLCLDDTDQANILTANRYTGEVFKSITSQIKSCSTEHDVLAILYQKTYQQSWFGCSFPPIVASGENARILHYKTNHQALNSDQLLLLDFGVRHHAMPADVSRTIPVSGRFNPLQKAIYTMVLTAQKKVEDCARAGVTIDELNTLCWSTIDSQLQTFLKENDGQISGYRKVPHFVSHLIGCAVHDGPAGRSYKESPLKAGMLISNEPGFYAHVRATIDGVSYDEPIGIRIEDNLLITSDGCQNMTHMIPKSPDDIEALLA